MRAIPHDTALDSTLALLADPYGFIGRRCDRLGTDLFEARILLRRTICLRGREGAQLFYDVRRFMRDAAIPEPLLATLFGQGGVQTLDGPAHAQRKALFTSLLSAPGVDRLASLSAEAWREASQRWRGHRRIVLYDAVQLLLARAACQWAGVALDNLPRRTRQLALLFEGAAALGHLRARAARKSLEAWLARQVEAVRQASQAAPPGSALQAVSSHLDADGQPLSAKVAAVELLNLLRPTVAVSVFIVFAAHAMHGHPAWLARLRGGNAEDVQAFVQEVRRFYPSFPAVMARSRAEFEWRGYSFRQGQRVMLDLHGIDHDPRLWEDPLAFRPERFLGRPPDPFGFVPQGGGDVHRQHRCPGEALAAALMTVALDWLAVRLGYYVPEQDLAIDMHRVPALPRSRFIIQDVTPLPEAAWPRFAFTPS